MKNWRPSVYTIVLTTAIVLIVGNAIVAVHLVRMGEEIFKQPDMCVI